MAQPKEIISSILASKKEIGGIDSVCFVACGGSLTALGAARSFLERNSKKLKVGFFSSNEFVHSTPCYFDANSLLITSSHSGNTPETVKAAELAKQLGAAVISMTYKEGSEITVSADHSIVYEWGEGSHPSLHKASYVLMLALELLHQTEGYSEYQSALDSFADFDRTVKDAIAASDEKLKHFAKEFKNSSIIYTMGSGANLHAAHQQSICIFMEMQWINSSAIHTGEYFHGPFEITDKNVPFILLMTAGSNRPVDERALAFLQKYSGMLMVLDSKELGADKLSPSFIPFLEPILFTNILGVFNNYIAAERDHPLSTRRYMWKFAY